MQAKIMLKYGGGLPSFKQCYGDYYVAGYRLGGDVGLMVSASGHAEALSETVAVEVKVKVLFVTKSHSESSTKTSASADRSLCVCGYDTLENTHMSESLQLGGSVDAMSEIASALSQAAQNLEHETEKRLRGSGLYDGRNVDLSTCDELIKANVVAELSLLPVDSVREVLQWTTNDDII